jgi:1-acyl-sn-glycerol-3-phosphate acyltransferase
MQVKTQNRASGARPQKRTLVREFLRGNKQIPQRLFSNVCRYLVRILLFPVCRVHLASFSKLRPRGGLIVASNHISHFDPPIVGAWYARYVDWMAMEELFRSRFGAALMHGLCAFPVRRDGTDRRAIREALARLAIGRTVGLFPEGGIRAGPQSILEGAPMWPGVCALSILSGKPIVPCVILGTDRLYHPGNWLPFRRVSIWIGVGDPLFPEETSRQADRREALQEQLSGAFVNLKNRLQEHYHLGPDDLPATPQARKREDHLPMSTHRCGARRAEHLKTGQE